MADEAILMIETHPAIPFTVTDATAVPKGTIMTMSDPMTATATAAAADIVAGVAKNEKIASDGKVSHPIYRGGIFKVTASGSITVGDALTTTTGGNRLITAPNTVENIWGEALETASDGHTFLAELNPFTINQA